MTCTESGFPPIQIVTTFIENMGPLAVDLERVGNPIALHQLAGQNYATDTYHTAEPKWYSEEISIASQIDGNYKQQPYRVWLDEVTLNAY